jgi:hypothetical protein
VKQLGVARPEQFRGVDDQGSAGADDHEQKAERERDPSVAPDEQPLDPDEAHW